MVKVKRSPNVPVSLTVESKKKKGSYREPDVIEQLAADFHGKCYICEIKPVQDPQVEHRLPHHNRSIPTRVFDWNNLFYSCGHCNSVKNVSKYEAGIIDCCVRDPEEALSYHLSENHVKVQVKDTTDAEAVLTADLIEEVFNSASTGIRTKAAQVRLRELQGIMCTLYKQLERYQQNPNDKRAIRALCGFLDRAAAFSGFARSFVRESRWDGLLRILDEEETFRQMNEEHAELRKANGQEA